MCMPKTFISGNKADAFKASTLCYNKEEMFADTDSLSA